MITYPRLKITRRMVSVLATVGQGHRGYHQSRYWVVLLVTGPGAEDQAYLGRDDGIIGWVDCVDFAHATIKAARSQR